jgi:hypothetical protein
MNWAAALAGDQNLLNREVTSMGRITVIGVMPRDFDSIARLTFESACF